jgi:hypothetical protein
MFNTTYFSLIYGLGKVYDEKKTKKPKHYPTYLNFQILAQNAWFEPLGGCQTGWHVKG